MRKFTKTQKRELRNRKKVKSVSVNRYRISVFKSLKNISAQIIDDKEKKTLVSASSIEKEIKSNKKKKSETSELLGEILAKRAAEKKITKVYFDRGSYKYHGRIKMFADSLRKNGLEFKMADIQKKESDIKERLVAINRITKVVKGGRRFGFAALVVVGNQKGTIGIGQGKSKQVPDAIKKATEDAKRNQIKVSLKDGKTLHHDVKGRNGSGKVLLRSAPAGTGIIAGGPIRAVCDVLGIQDIVAKSVGSANPHNVVKASINALLSQSSPKTLSAMRGKKISEIVAKREKAKWI